MRRRGGFSLVELLIAIAIIGVLSAILFPVFISARERAKRSYCVSNLRQTYMALQMYADDNYGYMPRFKDITAKEGAPRQQDGFALMLEYVKNKNVFFCPNGRFPEDTDKKSSVYTLVLPNEKLWVCSYNLLSDSYGTKVNNSWSNGWTPGRLDCTPSDRSLKLYEACEWNDARYKMAVAGGGPLVDDQLHVYGEKGQDRLGVLFINLKGTVQFVPTSKYPFIKQ